MTEYNIHKTSEIILIWLYRNNKTQQWLAEQFGLTRQALSTKLKDNFFSDSDKALLKRLNILTD